jgi:hypothetical protein
MSRQNINDEDIFKKVRGSKRAEQARPKMKVSGAGVKKLAKLIKSKKGKE